MPPTSRSSVNRAIRSRDRGLRTISVLTRGLVAVSVGVAGLFSAMAAWAQPGRSKTQTSSAARSTRRTLAPTATVGTAPAESGDDGGAVLAPPATVPDPGYQYTPPATVPDPGYQYTPPAQVPVYQYSPPPVVSGAT